MPTPAALPAQHTVLLVLNGASPPVYEVVANIGDWQPAPLSATEVDVSSHSTSEWDQWVVTILSAGVVTMPLFFIPSDPGHQAFFTLFADRGSGGDSDPGVPIDFRVDFPDAAETTYKYQGFIKEFKIEAPVKGVIKASISIRLTGEPDFAASRT